MTILPEMQCIGLVHSCFKEKFGIPRQPGLVLEARAEIEILPPFDRDEAFRSLESFSHIWVIFVFHQSQRDNWKATVRPPRLGGNQRVGVFASRSTFRPNPLGLSVVKFEGMVRRPGKLYLQISGVDLLQGTPVLDIKPYLPYADSLADAQSGYAPEAPEARGKLYFSDEAEVQCQQQAQNYPGGYPALFRLIDGLLRLDPRPAYRGGKEGATEVYAMHLLDFDLRWEVRGNDIQVLALDSRE
ncbi:tRNA (adenine(37)-N6)-methyltransferase [hydrothermal vent metagenome]|uniref:tRNA (Adenine(37)-N6)-methyltransferase n=1 Tax=hydrothermal vent metagenome TaxID=652676 RepID=A0A3B1B2X5_9ZZZZ